VAYARPDQQFIISLRMSGEVTVEAAIRQSGLLERFPEIDLTRNKVGIFSKIASSTRPCVTRTVWKSTGR
jgi:putative ubiquitin-RnfH superfamily antitoxin RatB of RatAB toxin-antitoxin module